MTAAIPVRRRGAAPKMPQFSLQMPGSAAPTTKPVPVEEIKAKDTERLFIDLDGSMISPFMTTEPGWGNGAASFDGSTAAPPPAKPQSRKFLRVDNTNLFMYIAGDNPSAASDMNSNPAERTPTSKPTEGPSLTVDQKGNHIDAPALEDLEINGVLGSGSQGTIRACRYKGTDYAIKEIQVSDALDRNGADVERQARKAGIVRELRILAKKKRTGGGGGGPLTGNGQDYVVAVYNAYFQQRALSILMERMSSSLEDLQKALEPLDWTSVKKSAQKIFDKHFSGDKQFSATPMMDLTMTPIATPLKTPGSNLSNSSGVSGGAGSSTSGSLVPWPERSETTATIVRDKNQDDVWEDIDSKGRQTSAIIRTQHSDRSNDRGQTKQSINYFGGAKIELERIPALPECVLSLIARDSLLGLTYLHDSLRVVHTDIKPANLMFSQSQQTVKLADFGCNMELNDQGVVPHNSGPMLGTKLYMSPERWNESGNGFNAKSDIWSLGISIMELANGCHPCVTFQEDFWSFVDRLRIEKMVRPVMCSELFYDFLKKCLAVDPSLRPSASELLNHDFIRKYEKVPRSRFAAFLKAIAKEGQDKFVKRQKDRMQSLLSVAVKTKDNDLKKKNAKKWAGYTGNTGIGSKPPTLDDFPELC